MASPNTSAASVRAYYERNTRLFLQLGRRRQATAIHRAIWAAGVATKAEALHAINQLIGNTIAEFAMRPATEPVRVLDLGCGVGGTLLALARQLPGQVQGLGVSISPTQVRLATASGRIQPSALSPQPSSSCHFVEADYGHLPCAEQFDVAVAVEALVHAPDLARVLHQAAAALRPGGHLLICDDMLADASTAPADPNALAWVAAFRRGWRAPSVVTLTEFVNLARQAGFEPIAERNLTPDLRLLRLPLPVGQALLRLGQLVPAEWAFTQSLLGGLALQYGLEYGVIRYQWLVLRKRGG